MASLVYDDIFGLDERARGLASAAAEPWAVIGLIYGARMATRLFAKGADHILAFLSKVTIAVALALIVFAAAPNVGVAIAAHSVIVAAFAIIARSEEHTSELQSLMRSSYAVFCLKKKT